MSGMRRIVFRPGGYPMLTKLISAAVMGSVLFFGTSVIVAQPVQFDYLSFDLPGSSGTGAFGVGLDNNIVGRYVLGNAMHGFLLSNGSPITVDPPYGIPGTSWAYGINPVGRSEEHTSELQSQFHLVCRLLLEKKN